MLISDLWVPSPTWWVHSVDEYEFREMFAGTVGEQQIELFRVPPQSDADYFANYFPSRLFRTLATFGNATKREITRIALIYQLEAGNISLPEYQIKAIK